MKKLTTALIITAAYLAAGCGPSAKELEEKRIYDSIQAADSLIAVRSARYASTLEDNAKKNTTSKPNSQTSKKKTNEDVLKEYIILPDGAILSRAPVTLGYARLINSTEAIMPLTYGSSLENSNIYNYQKLAFKTGNSAAQSDILNLATVEPMTIVPGGIYKVSYYNKLKGTVTEQALYTYMIYNTKAIDKDMDATLKNYNKPIYNRPLRDIDGIIKSVELVK